MNRFEVFALKSQLEALAQIAHNLRVESEKSLSDMGLVYLNQLEAGIDNLLQAITDVYEEFEK